MVTFWGVSVPLSAVVVEFFLSLSRLPSLAVVLVLHHRLPPQAAVPVLLLLHCSLLRHQMRMRRNADDLLLQVTIFQQNANALLLFFKKNLSLILQERLARESSDNFLLDFVFAFILSFFFLK